MIFVYAEVIRQAMRGNDAAAGVQLMRSQEPSGGALSRANSFLDSNGDGMDVNEVRGRGSCNDMSEMKSNEVKDRDDINALYNHGLCRWPGCETPCDDLTAFKK